MSQATSRSDGIPTMGSKPVKEVRVVNTSDVVGDKSDRQKKAEIFSRIYQPVAADLAEVESLLLSELRSETPFVDQLLEHSRLLGGKRMRPVLLLLSGACCGELNHGHKSLAAALEMIHLATLIHDDVIDESETRRHQPTAHQQWGNKTSVLLGDYLFTHSFSLASQADSVTALKMLANASNRVCEGEMKQNSWKSNFDLSESDYLEMISEKTGELCAVACGMGVLLSGCDADRVEQFRKFGSDLGTSFQIIDDVLDLIGDPSAVGKTLGTDLVNQKPTLPVIHALAILEGEARREFLALLNTDCDSATEQVSVHRAVIETLTQTGSIEYSRLAAKRFAEEAMKFAQSCVDGAGDENSRKAAASLVEVGKFILQRSF